MPQTGSIVLSGKGLQVVNAFLQSEVGGGWRGGKSKAGSRQLVRGGFCLLIGYLNPLPLVP